MSRETVVVLEVESKVKLSTVERFRTNVPAES